MLEKGSKAPEFTLPDKDGNVICLSDFLGKKVVLYFYPKDNTPGCSRQACAFAAAYDGFKSKDVVVIGVSVRAEIWDKARWEELCSKLTSDVIGEAMEELGF